MSSSADEYGSADEDSLDSGNCSPLYSDENDFEEGKIFASVILDYK